MNGLRKESQYNGWVGGRALQMRLGRGGLLSIPALSVWFAPVDWLLFLYIWLGISEGRELRVHGEWRSRRVPGELDDGKAMKSWVTWQGEGAGPSQLLLRTK